MFRSSNPGQEIDVIAAVVDRISYPPRASSVFNMMSGITPVNGFEGISVAILDSEAAAPNLWNPRDWINGKRTNTIQQRCTISLKFQHSSMKLAFMAAQTPSLSWTSRTVQLPVANTLFHNGQESTLVATRWALSGTKASKSKPVLLKKTMLQQQSLEMAPLSQQNVSYQKNKLYVNLSPITISQIVAGAMGNIVSNLFAGKSSEATVPASEELEKAMSHHLKTSKYLDKSITVWALITPRENRINQPRAPMTLQESIESGSRLHRVLSGGGGWGAKRGLLSLDPDSRYHNPQAEKPKAFGNIGNIDAEKADALGEVVRQGDLIRFFVPGRVRESNNKPKRNSLGLRAWEITVGTSVLLGTLPSSMDVLTGREVSSESGQEAFDFIFFRNFFGILSEHGMSLKVETDGPAESADQFGTIVQTKLDSPYSYLYLNVGGVDSLGSRYSRVIDVKSSSYIRKIRTSNLSYVRRPNFELLNLKEPKVFPYHLLKDISTDVSQKAQEKRRMIEGSDQEIALSSEPTETKLASDEQSIRPPVTNVARKVATPTSAKYLVLREPNQVRPLFRPYLSAAPAQDVIFETSPKSRAMEIYNQNKSLKWSQDLSHYVH